MRFAWFFVLLVGSCFSLAARTDAQTTIGVPADSKFVLQIDFQSLRNSKIGATLMEVAKKAAMEEVGKKLDKDELSMKKVRDILGFDPFEEVQGVVLAASDYEHPEKSLVGMLRLKKSTGNIEGLLLSIPGYEKSDYGKYEIHSAAPSDKERFYGAIHKNASGDHTLIVGANKSSVTSLLDGLDAKRDESRSLRTVELNGDRKMMLSMQLMELPSKKVVGEGPQANIVALLNSFVFSIFEEDDELEIRGSLNTSNEKQADKIRQAVQGLGAMVELFASLEDQQDKDAKELLKVLSQIKVAQEGNNVRVKARFPSGQVAEFIKNEIGK